MLLLLTITIIATTQSLLLQRAPITPIELELGTTLTRNISTRFNNFQYSFLRNFISQNSSVPSRACYVSVQKEGRLDLVSEIGYSADQEGGKTQKWLEDRIIVYFEDLLNMKIFSDAIYFNDEIYAFFTTNQIVVYGFDKKSGELTKKNTIVLDAKPAVQAQFVQIGQQLLLISRYRAVRINQNGTLDLLNEFSGQTDLITDLKVRKNTVYIAFGQKGISTYNYNSTQNTLSFVKSSRFSFRTDKERADFAVDEFDIDTLTNSLYILDYTEGLLEVPLNKMAQLTQVNSETARLLVSGCSNIVVLPYSIYVTCPELIQIQRDNYKIQSIIHNTFYPSKMVHINERLYLSDRDNFAVYDLFGKVIDQYQLKVHGQESLMLHGHVVTFGMERVVSQAITVQKQALVCYSQDQGVYEGTVITQGVCGEYNDSIPQDFDMTDVCTYEEPFTITFKNEHLLDLGTQMWLAIIWLASLSIIGLALLIHHCRTVRKYQPLTEEDFRQLVDLSKNADMRQQRESKAQEIVLTES